MNIASSDPTPCLKPYYNLTQITPHFGAEVHGLDLNGSPLSDEIIAQIKEEIKKHRLLVFKGQGLISGDKQVQLSQQLGALDSTFYKHPRSPHPDIFRVSNDEEEGCTRVDGTFQPKPFQYQTMHFHGICEGGDTWFVPLKEFYELQDEATRQRWDKLWMITGKGNFAHPLVYKHPIRGDTSMVLHCGAPFCTGWAVDDDNPSTRERRVVRMLLAAEVQRELSQRLDDAVDTIGIKMQWEVGDFAINDNLGTAHYAVPGTQAPRERGLRILHRTTVASEAVPEKADGRRSFLFK